ncbi:ATP-binding cassette domain-containing protein [Altererythrobacter sp. ZODW24]|uniref:ATP-binding cassette domain-containing protein n=1 Tax=Altererythrobacter sp. ZODW24 TaxID=2185142 RepID=UPI0019646B46|nr:ATP-binding cassette domain-containing protein [Altererythrobacter sp. ZODW24]
MSKSFAAERRGTPATEALIDIELKVAPGTLLGLVGPDASGKTTLLRMLAGLAEADSGEISVFGKPVSQLDRSLVGYMPQGGALYSELSVEQNLDLYARLRGIDPAAEPERIENIYRLTGLGDFRERAAGKLSGGMRQKLALACAVVAAPPLMLLDEPSVGVDPLSRREIWQLARDLSGPDTTIVWATSILDDAEKCDELLVLHEGQVRYSGASAGLTAFAEGKVYSMPVLAAERRHELARVHRLQETIDAQIEGDGIRFVNRVAVTGAAAAIPRAADGFVALLDDGLQLEESELAASFPDRRDTIGTSGAAIAAVGLTKHYGSFTAAYDVSFTVAPGEVFGLLGPNGAGKSTTFRMLCGLLKSSEGRSTVAGQNLRTAGPEARKALGYMPQYFGLYGDLTVAANLQFIAGAHGLSRKGAKDAIDGVVSALSLEPIMSQRAGLLPIGVKQRLSLATAVLHRPEVLFLDEPTSGVDPLVRREFWHHINAIAETGVAVLVTTHFMDEAENCDRLMLINRSRAIAQGTPAELKKGIARGGPEPTLEEAFIKLIESQRSLNMEAA